MTTIINASTSSGLVQTADTSGVLALQTAGTTAVTVGSDQSFAITAATGAVPFKASVNGVEAARIDSSGNLLVGTTNAGLFGSTSTCKIIPSNATYPGGISTGHWTTGNAIDFFSNISGTAAFTGAISLSGSTTTYGTSSDYRLKENIAPMTGALQTVSQLKPCRYTWKMDGSQGQGFIAHELAEVVPECVTGAKDAVDADGNPKYQGIDTSFLVATLTAAIQELKAIVDEQAAKITALENK